MELRRLAERGREGHGHRAQAGAGAQEPREHGVLRRFPQSFDFILGDMFDAIDDVESCDVVFCFGVFYHINNHMLLLSKIARLNPRVLILDTNISLSDRPVIELVHEENGGPLDRSAEQAGPRRDVRKLRLELRLLRLDWFGPDGSGRRSVVRLLVGTKAPGTKAHRRGEVSLARTVSRVLRSARRPATDE